MKPDARSSPSGRSTASPSLAAAGFNPRGRSRISVAAVSAPALRPLKEGDAGAIARWYAKAMVLAGTPMPLSEVLDSPIAGLERILPLGQDERALPSARGEPGPPSARGEAGPPSARGEAGPPSARGEPVEPRAEHRRTSSVLVLTEGNTADPAGLLVAAFDDPEPGWATVALLAVAGREQRDLAAEGVEQLEARLRPRAGHVRAAVPLDVGLALYFWLRLGYRPVATGGRLWMLRDLEG